jgi:hypothetical protein
MIGKRATTVQYAAHALEIERVSETCDHGGLVSN